jgi:hypothetical protein
MLRQNQLAGFGSDFPPPTGDPFLRAVCCLINPAYRADAIGFYQFPTELGNYPPPFDVYTSDLDNPVIYTSGASNSTLRDSVEGVFNVGVVDLLTFTGSAIADGTNMLTGSFGTIELTLERTGAYWPYLGSIAIIGSNNYGGSGFVLYWDGANYLFYRGGPVDSWADSNDPMPLNEVVHWAVELTGANINIFRNGTLLRSIVSAAGNASQSAWYIGGASLGTPFNYFFKLYAARMTDQHDTLGFRYGGATDSFTPPEVPYPETLP